MCPPSTVPCSHFDKLKSTLVQPKYCSVVGAPLTSSLADQFEIKHGKRLNNGYGSTESKIIAVNLSVPSESVGQNSAQLYYQDTGWTGQGKELPDGEEGEIVICGPMLMLGYIGQTDETGKVIEGTCYHTGDIGHMDKGYLFISGRAKEMINVAGNKVFPEVEGALKNCPLVKEVGRNWSRKLQARSDSQCPYRHHRRVFAQRPQKREHSQSSKGHTQRKIT